MRPTQRSEEGAGAGAGGTPEVDLEAHQHLIDQTAAAAAEAASTAEAAPDHHSVWTTVYAKRKQIRPGRARMQGIIIKRVFSERERIRGFSLASHMPAHSHSEPS